MDHMVRRFHNSPGHQDSLQVPTQQDSRANLTFQKSWIWLENPSLIGVLMGQSSINGYGKVNYSNNAKRFQDHGRTSTWQLFCWICIATWCRTCFRVSLLASIHWKSRPKIWHWNAPDFGWLFVLLPCLGTRFETCGLDMSLDRLTRQKQIPEYANYWARPHDPTLLEWGLLIWGIIPKWPWSLVN